MPNVQTQTAKLALSSRTSLAAALAFGAALSPQALAQTTTNSPATNAPATNPLSAPQIAANSEVAPLSSPTTASPAPPAAGVASTHENKGVGESEVTAARTTLTAGLDLYSGVSNVAGQRRISDGFWGPAAGPFYPSALALQLQGKDGSAARFALGAGDVFRGPNRSVGQPMEAWVQKPIGKYSVMAGKFFVPLALQEWQYESRYGVQLQRTLGASDFAASVNYSNIKNRPNVYFRAGRNFSETVNAGLSLAAGQGLSYGSIHNKGIGLDVSVQRKGFQLFSEALLLQRRASDRFHFFHSKFVYTRSPRFQPFLGYYNFADRNNELGEFKGLSYGTALQLRPQVFLEAGGTVHSGKNSYFLQLHLLTERSLFTSRPPGVVPPGVMP